MSKHVQASIEVKNSFDFLRASCCDLARHMQMLYGNLQIISSLFPERFQHCSHSILRFYRLRQKSSGDEEAFNWTNNHCQDRSSKSTTKRHKRTSRSSINCWTWFVVPLKYPKSLWEQPQPVPICHAAFGLSQRSFQDHTFLEGGWINILGIRSLGEIVFKYV